MELENLAAISSKHNDEVEVEDDDDDDDMFLPGFRFHPTDEELVGFYLRRKVENRLATLDFIKQIDIYKFDPWDLPVASSESGGENEWYFFCKRGRKYKNSIRPNRVTAGSGFWKATGIDRPIYSGGSGHCCIGLKKSLVYYRGSAGKGTKTEWMMHEFRLPPQLLPTHHSNNISQQPAEVWTLCRILKRKSMLELKELTGKRNSSSNPSTQTCCSSKESASIISIRENYISFTNPHNINIHTNKHNYDEERPFGINVNIARNDNNADYHHQVFNTGHHTNNNTHPPADNYQSHYHPYPAAANSLSTTFTSATPQINEILKHADWEELRSVLGFATHP